MLEIKILSLFVGSLGLQAAIASGWLRWQQTITEQQRDEEEELLTSYESKDTYTATNSQQENGAVKASKDPRLVGWEFKIVRAERDLFRDPAVFKRLCQEEAESGWILLEKLDDRRVRFKRPISLRDIIRSEFLQHDPYRTHYGPSSNWGTIILAIITVTAIVLPAYLGYTLVSVTLGNAQTNQPSNSPKSSPSPHTSPAASSPTPAASPSPDATTSDR